MVSCRRAVSSCYYALFHCLARECADLLIGGKGSRRSNEAWRQVYRSLEHHQVKEKCMNTNMIKKFPNGIQDFANTFVLMQKKRHDADYDPFGIFTKSSVERDINLVEETIKKFKLEPVQDRRAFCAYVLFRKHIWN